MKREDHEHKTQYICRGECGAKLQRDEYEHHETKVCGAETCSHKGQPFIKEEYCVDCGHPCDQEHSCC